MGLVVKGSWRGPADEVLSILRCTTCTAQFCKSSKKASISLNICISRLRAEEGDLCAG